MAQLPDAEHDAAGSNYQPVLGSTIGDQHRKGPLRDYDEEVAEQIGRPVPLEILAGPFPYTCAILNTIRRKCLKRTVELQAVSLNAYYDRVVVKLSKTTTESLDRASGTDEAVLDIIGRIQNIIIRRASPEQITSVAENVYTLFRDSRFTNTDYAATSRI